MDLKLKEEKLQDRLERLDAMEQEILAREQALKARQAAAEGAKKQLVLRLSQRLWDDIAAWAEEDFRSINGQIEYLLNEAVKNRRRGGKG